MESLPWREQMQQLGIEELCGQYTVQVCAGYLARKEGSCPPQWGWGVVGNGGRPHSRGAAYVES